jgi:hypothetical protein
MSYASPTSWTDVDFAGNALDWTSRTNKLLYPAYEMLRKGNTERVRGANLPSGNWPYMDSAFSEISLIPYAFKNYYGPSYTYYANSSGADVTFTAALNPTVNPPVLDNWTKAAILSAIGDGSLVAASHLHLEEWELQKKKLLNQCRWTHNVAAMQFHSIDSSRITWAGDKSSLVIQHCVPQVSYGSRFPTHLWDIWVSEKIGTMNAYQTPHKIHSEWVAADMESGDTYDTGTLVSADIFDSDPAHLSLYSEFYEVLKFNYGNDYGHGFLFYDWVPETIPI